MEKYLIESLDQKFEYKTFRIFFSVRDSLPAEEVLNTLDRASPGLLKIFDLAETPKYDVFIYSDPASIEKATGKPLMQGEGVRVVPADNVMLLCSCRLPNMIDEEISRHLSYQIFNSEMGDREVAPHQYRCPSWLREGTCLQVSSRLRRDTKPYLLGGWASLQEAEKADRLIKPNILEKSVYLIPDPQRRALAIHQSFYMVKHLLGLYPEKFFKRFGTMMKVLDDAEAEKVFTQVANLNFEKLFTLFREWVRTTNGLIAISTD